ncbi:hypothetical protein DFH28DRAFT_1224818, partial [Melampsora americana]
NLRFYVNNLNSFYHCAVILKNFLLCCGRGALGGVAAPPTLEGYLGSLWIGADHFQIDHNDLND